MDINSISLENSEFCNYFEFILNFLNPSESRIERLKSQLELKLSSQGEIQYTIGLDNKGESIGLSMATLEQAISTMQLIASKINANLTVLNKTNLGTGEIAQVLIRKARMQAIIIDIRIALLGESQVGKSTMIGVICKGVRENGKGSARNAILRHLHEKKLGFTTSITHHLVGFNHEGKALKSNQNWADLIFNSSKLISFIDLPGHEKFRNTLLYGLISQSPEYVVLMIDPEKMNETQNLEYLNFISALKLPFFIILSKVEKVSTKVLDLSLDFLNTELRKKEFILMEVLNQEDVVLYSRIFLQEKIVPLFPISFKTLKNCDLFLSFLNLLPSRYKWDDISSTEFYLEKWFIRENSVILCGIMIKGKARVGEKLLLGPASDGSFRTVQIIGIHVKEIPVHSVSAGQFCSFQINGNYELRRGMVLVDFKAAPFAAFEFECLIWTIDNDLRGRVIKAAYKPLIYTQTIRQCAFILEGPKEIEPNRVMKFKLRFLYHPEYITPGTKLMIKDTFMTALGTIIAVKSI